jgi:hypothetical protein
MGPLCGSDGSAVQTLKMVLHRASMGPERRYLSSIAQGVREMCRGGKRGCEEAKTTRAVNTSWPAGNGVLRPAPADHNTLQACPGPGVAAPNIRLHVRAPLQKAG